MGRLKINFSEFAAAFVVLLFGVFLIVEGNNYSLGSLRRMGPGFFPVSLGAIMVGLGAILLFQAVFAAREEIAFDWRPIVCVAGSIIVFAIITPRFGLVPAAFLMIVLSAFAERPASLKTGVITGVVMAALGYGVFIYGLGLPIDAVRW
ncbi:MAG: tripartite tricarboxylate transporter TctB family protein [Ectothiorhodospiraceae bacterium]|nr:tripartite tricarboxylate transporter TctB family protein [Ectothiorhodospiraceae bacterium]